MKPHQTATTDGVTRSGEEAKATKSKDWKRGWLQSREEWTEEARDAVVLWMTGRVDIMVTEVFMVVRERNIQLPMGEIEAFCRRYPIRKLSLFGSVLREDFTDKSDVDFLVELMPHSGIGLFKFMEMQFALADMIGREVDLRTPEDLGERFREQVLRDAEVIYLRED